jgi:hypothetical protein
MYKTCSVLLVAVFTVSCNWVQLTSEGQRVRLASTSEVSACTRIGGTTATTTGRVWIAERGSEKVQEELITLARNEAGSMGGNTIAPEGAIEEGAQRFNVYRCPQ